MRAFTQLFPTEGRSNLKATINAVAKAVNAFDVETVLVFAAFAKGALKLRSVVDDTRSIVVVTFPAGYTALVGDVPAYVGVVDKVEQRKLREAGIEVIRGVMPFAALGDEGSRETQVLKSALELFGGGLQLCIQAVLMGCDAGAVQGGSRCIAMSADTAIVAHAENAFRSFSKTSRLAVEHVICKPVSYSISRPAVIAQPTRQKSILTIENPKSDTLSLE